jgi:Flp pilus assembly protein TadB
MAESPPRPPQSRRPPRRLADEEPFATMRIRPRRFWIGVPLVFVVAIGVGTILAARNLSLGLAALLVIQTAGLAWLYVPVLRERMRVERAAWEERQGREAPEETPERRPGE